MEVVLHHPESPKSAPRRSAVEIPCRRRASTTDLENAFVDEIITSSPNQKGCVLCSLPSTGVVVGDKDEQIHIFPYCSAEHRTILRTLSSRLALNYETKE